MKAKFTSNNVQNGKNYGNDKETVSTYNVIAYHKGEFLNPVTCRCYMGRSRNAATVYAAIWCHSRIKEIDAAGHGSAGGYGYHKESAAIQYAISNAGIKLFGSAYTRRDEKEDLTKECHIDGVGDTAIESALLAIGRALGYTKLYLCKG